MIHIFTYLYILHLSILFSFWKVRFYFYSMKFYICLNKPHPKIESKKDRVLHFSRNTQSVGF